ncbi:MAG: MnmC family methyltransferase, partial [Thermus sp.]
QLEVSADDLVFENGRFHVRGAPDRGMTIQEVALQAYLAWNLPDGMEPGLEGQANWDPSNFVFPFGTHACVVEVDPETGQVRILRYVAVEKEPLPKELLAQIPLPLPRAEAVMAGILKAWPLERFQGPWGELRILFGKVEEVGLPQNWATAVYLDPFSPRVNPEPWSFPVLQKLCRALRRGGRLATYSAQGAFRRALKEAGFALHRVPAEGKREWTVGIALKAPPG